MILGPYWGCFFLWLSSLEKFLIPTFHQVDLCSQNCTKSELWKDPFLISGCIENYGTVPLYLHVCFDTFTIVYTLGNVHVYRPSLRDRWQLRWWLHRFTSWLEDFFKQLRHGGLDCPLSFLNTLNLRFLEIDLCGELELHNKCWCLFSKGWFVQWFFLEFSVDTSMSSSACTCVCLSFSPLVFETLKKHDDTSITSKWLEVPCVSLVIHWRKPYVFYCILPELSTCFPMMLLVASHLRKLSGRTWAEAS